MILERDEYDEPRKKVGNLSNFALIKDELKILVGATSEDRLLLTIGLKQLEHRVAVVSGSLSDILALRKADVGVALGASGTDITRQASNFIILDDNFVSIVKTIKWSRNTLSICR